MGCNGSKESSDEIEMQRLRKGRHSAQSRDGPVHRDASGRPVRHESFMLDRSTPQRALNDMAAHLAQNGVMANIVAVGGAVDTLYLQSQDRDSTHDVDFFLASPQAPEHRSIHEAAQHANQQLNGSLGAQWFKNTTQITMGRSVQQAVAAAAFEQNTVVFEQVRGNEGLRIYAAPWSYALCDKLNRLADTNPRLYEYDLADAVIYLHEHLHTHRQRTVRAETVQEWCRQYGKSVTQAVLQQVDEAYYRKYERKPIAW